MCECNVLSKSTPHWCHKGSNPELLVWSPMCKLHLNHKASSASTPYSKKVTGTWVQKDLICNQFPSKTSPNLEDHMTVLMLKFLTFPLLSNRDCKIKIIWSESSVQSPVSHFLRWESLFFISYSKCILFWLVLKYPLSLFTMPLRL